MKKLHIEKSDLESVGLSPDQRDYLRRIGLSIQAVLLYELLLRKGKLTAQGAAAYTGDFPSAEYRLFYDLESHRLVRRLPGRPRAFEALPLPIGLKSSLHDTEKELRELIGRTLKDNQISSDSAEIVLGREALYDTYIRFAHTAEYEICLYSIGIAFSDKLETTQRAAIKRGVSIKHVIQQRSLSNQHVIAKWLRAGVRLRYLKQARGFHFFVIDRRVVCITFSDPEDTDNRLSILTDNPAVAELFMQQFQSIWLQAKLMET